jgi:hypothetical protein
MKFNLFFRGALALMMVFLISLETQSSPTAKYSPAGTWEYSVPGVPEGYDRGVMVITENEEGYVVEVGPSQDYLMKAEKVEYSNKKLSFVVYVEYEEVKISGEFKSDKFEGKVSYVEGEFDMTADRAPES